MARISVVDDYPDFIDMMTSILDEVAGCEVVGLDASETTVDDVLETRPDLLIIDLDTAENVWFGTGALGGNAAAALRSVPTIVCSGDIPRLRQRSDDFSDVGNVYPLEKPFTLDTFMDLVERALSPAVLSPVA